MTPGDDCPTDVVKMDFDLTKYLGLWYEYRPSFGQVFRPPGQDCIQAKYSMRDDGLVRVLNSGQMRDDIEYKFQPRTTLEGKARSAATVEGEGKLEV